MKYISLSIPGYDIQAPTELPQLGENGKIVHGQNIFQFTLQILLFAGVILALLFLLIGGVQWILSSGDKQKLQAAQGKITYAIIGIVIIFLSFFIMAVIGHLFNIDLSKVSTL